MQFDAFACLYIVYNRVGNLLLYLLHMVATGCILRVLLSSTGFIILQVQSWQKSVKNSSVEYSDIQAIQLDRYNWGRTEALTRSLLLHSSYSVM